MARGKKGRSHRHGHRSFSIPEDVGVMSYIGTSLAHTSNLEEADDEVSSDESENEFKEEAEKTGEGKGSKSLFEIENPNLFKEKNMKAKNADVDIPVALSRREREELEKQKAHERHMRLHEQGKTVQARKDLERLSVIRQERENAARKRVEEKNVLYCSWDV